MTGFVFYGDCVAAVVAEVTPKEGANMGAAVIQATDLSGFVAFYVAVMIGVVLIPLALHGIAKGIAAILRGE